MHKKIGGKYYCPVCNHESIVRLEKCPSCKPSSADRIKKVKTKKKGCGCGK